MPGSPLEGLPLTTAAIAVVLSAIVSLIGSAARRQAVLDGRAKAQDLAELSGLRSLQALQDAFGPPNMDSIWRDVTLAEIDRKRTPLGRLISDPVVDYASIGAAILPLFVNGPYTALGVWAAAAVQTVGWIGAARLPR
ncbi:MAG: hypothetical protein AAFQ67_02070 [Pseudomonadota bacterium]